MKKLIYSVLTLLVTNTFVSFSTVSASTNAGDMMRYYNLNKGTYLFTVNAKEIEKIKTMNYLQPQGAVFTTAQSGTKMYRFYHQKTGRYVFTGKQNEIENMKKNGWVYEGFAFYSGGNVPIHRLYHHATGQHFYTGNVNEVDAFIRKGWVNEGIGFYASSSVKRDIYETLTYEKTEDNTTVRITLTGKNGILQSSQEQTTGRFPQPLTDYQLELLKPRLLQQISQDQNANKLKGINGVTITTNLTKEFFQVKVVYDYTKASAAQLKAAGGGHASLTDALVVGDRVQMPVSAVDFGLRQAGYTRLSAK